jgi:hypothetical protein
MRNAPFSEIELLRDGLNAIAKRLPPGWSITKIERPRLRLRDFSPDATFEIKAPDGKRANVTVEVKKTLEPRNVQQVVDQLRQYGGNASLLIANFIGSRARELLRESQTGFVDPTGNLWLSLSRPGLFVETVGAAKDPTRVERPLQSLRGSAAARTLRALCELKPPFRVRELAERINVSPATLSRVIDLLNREALVKRDDKGAILQLDWERCIRRWSEDYSFTKSNRVRTFLDPRGISVLREKLSQTAWNYAATGSLAASLVAPVAAPRLAQIYVEEANVAADALGLREAEAGANTMLVEPFDRVVFDRTTKRSGVVCAALPQVAVDLLTGPGRGPEEAEALMTWMAKNVDVWRN